MQFAMFRAQTLPTSDPGRDVASFERMRTDLMPAKKGRARRRSHAGDEVRAWEFWVDAEEDGVAVRQSSGAIFNIKTFNVYMDNLSSDRLPKHAVLHFFRCGINPGGSDPQNEQGSQIRFNASSRSLHRYWVDIALMLIGSGDDVNEPVRPPKSGLSLVNGITCDTKRNRISLWLSDRGAGARDQVVDVLSPLLPPDKSLEFFTGGLDEAESVDGSQQCSSHSPASNEGLAPAGSSGIRLRDCCPAQPAMRRAISVPDLRDSGPSSAGSARATCYRSDSAAAWSSSDKHSSQLSSRGFTPTGMSSWTDSQQVPYGLTTPLGRATAKSSLANMHQAWGTGKKPQQRVGRRRALSHGDHCSYVPSSPLTNQKNPRPQRVHTVSALAATDMGVDPETLGVSAGLQTVVSFEDEEWESVLSQVHKQRLKDMPSKAQDTSPPGETHGMEEAAQHNHTNVLRSVTYGAHGAPGPDLEALASQLLPPPVAQPRASTCLDLSTTLNMLNSVSSDQEDAEKQEPNRKLSKKEKARLKKESALAAGETDDKKKKENVNILGIEDPPCVNGGIEIQNVAKFASQHISGLPPFVLPEVVAEEQKYSKSRSPRNRRKIRERKIKEAAESTKQEMEVWCPIYGAAPLSWVSPVENLILMKPEPITEDDWWRLVQACRKERVPMNQLPQLTEEMLQGLSVDSTLTWKNLSLVGIIHGPTPNPLDTILSQMDLAGVAYKPPPPEPPAPAPRKAAGKRSPRSSPRGSPRSSPRNSPKSSPKTSPRSSPRSKPKKKRAGADGEDLSPSQSPVLSPL